MGHKNLTNDDHGEFRGSGHGGGGPQVGDVIGGSPTDHVNVIKPKCESIWNGGLPLLLAVPTSM